MSPSDPTCSFATESLRVQRRGAEIACWLALPLVPAFALLDLIIAPERVELFLGIRLACAATIALVLAVLRTPFGARHPIGLGVAAACTCGLMVDVLTIFTGREASPYYAGVNLVQVAIALLLPLSASWVLLTCGVIIGGYLLCLLATGPIADPRILASNLLFLGSTCLITVVAASHRERLRAREFSTRHALAEALRHKSEFMAKMSHELRTPLHVVIGYADILLEDHLPRAGDARQLVTQVRDRSVHLHRLITDILDYSKTEAGQMEIRLVPTRVDDVMNRVAASFRPLVERRQLRLTVEAPDPLPELVSDAQKLEQILTNLVGNAVKFTASGGVTLEARLVEPHDASLDGVVLLGAPGGAVPSIRAPMDRILAILVHDTGIGIDPKDIGRLAGDFAQLEGTAARYGGTGLGLSIVRRLTELLGGQVGVRSRLSAGTTFAVLFPVITSPLRAAA